MCIRDRRINDLVSAGLLTKQQTECSGGEQLEIREGQAYVR